MLHLPRISMAKELLIRAVKRGHTVRPASIVASTGGKRGCPTLGERGKRATPVEQGHRGSVQQRFVRNAAGKTLRKGSRGKSAVLRMKR